MYKQFNEIQDIRDYFRIENNVDSSLFSFNKRPTFQIFAHAEDMPSSVQIGKISGEYVSVRLEVAYKADEILELMHRYIESGVHYDVAKIALVLIDDAYRLVFETEHFELEVFDSNDIDEIIRKISL